MECNRAFIIIRQVGILTCAQRSHWFHERHATKFSLPRCSNLILDEKMHSCIGDFCLTAAIGLLQFVKNVKAQPDLIFYAEGRVEPLCNYYALAQVEAYVSMRQHEDIDTQPASEYPLRFKKCVLSAGTQQNSL